MNNPEKFYYTNSDEWLSVEGNTATLGITNYAQEQLSDIVFVEITVEVGDEVKKHDHVATVESVKAAADVNIPISGKIIETNENLSNNPELVNSNPYDKAWMIKFEVTDPSELSTLMNADSYAEYCSTRSH